MNDKLLKVVDRFAGLRVGVIGEAMLDVYTEGDVSRICREAPVPVVTVSEERAVPGGAANTAANLVSLGARPRFLSVVGDDYEGELNEMRRVTKSGGWLIICNGDDEFQRALPDGELLRRGFEAFRHESPSGGIIYNYRLRV